MNLHLALSSIPLITKAVYMAGATHILESYFNLKEFKTSHSIYQIYRIMKKEKWFCSILDSGLYNLMMGDTLQQGDKSVEDVRSYCRNYLTFIKKFDCFDYYVELDVQTILGGRSLNHYRKRIEQEFDVDKFIFVWHCSKDNIDELKRLAKRYSYIGFPVWEIQQYLNPPYKARIIQLLKIAKQANPKVKVHLFGCTTFDYLRNPYWYSIDSTAWQSAGHFGSYRYARDDGSIDFYETTDKERGLYQVRHTMSKEMVDLFLNRKEKFERKVGMVNMTKGKENVLLSLAFGAYHYNRMTKKIKEQYAG